jgi:DNA-binding response OmpR family regulator
MPGAIGADTRGVQRNGHARGPARILLVEDDPDVRTLLSFALESEGFVVDQAATADEGLTRLSATRYQLVLTDFALPRRTGGWMLKQAERRGLLSGTPAIVVTAHPNPDGVDGVPIVRKPIDIDDFIVRVRVAVQGATSR